MASLSDIANITVSTLTAAVKQDGFGLPLIADYHTRFSERVRLYSDLDGMVDDGFAVTDAAYLAASAAFAQDPQLNQVAIGRRALAPTLSFNVYPTAVNSKAYALEIIRPNGVVASISVTSDSSATVAEIVAALQTPIDALADVVAVDNTTHVTITASVAGSWFSVKVADKALLRLDAAGTDPGIATDLAAIKLENDSWYGLTLTSQGGAEIEAAATWAEANKKLMIQATADGDVIVSGSSDIASTLKAANLSRTALIFASDPSEHAGAAFLGSTFPIDPGGLTFKFRQLASVTTEQLTSSHIAQLKAKNCNYFADYGGSSLTAEGKMASGEWIDIIRDRDWYESDLQAEVVQVMLNNDKVPMTDGGIAMLEAAVRRSTRKAILNGFLAEGTDSYIVPKAADISPVDRGNRTLGSSPIKVSARVAGAIHLAEIRATITV